MRTFIIALCILTTLMLVLAIHSVMINRILGKIDAELALLPQDTDLILQMEESELVKAMANIARAHGLWKKNYFYVILTMPVKNIEEFEDEFLRAKTYFYEENYEEYLASLTLARLKLQTLKFLERVSVENIF